MSKFQINVLMDSPTKNIFVDIPSNISKHNSKFLVTSIIGKMATGPSPVFIHSSALQNGSIIYTSDSSSDLIASTVLTDVATNSYSINAKKNDIGYDFPINLRNNCYLDFILKDHTGALLTDIEYLVLTIEIFIAEAIKIE